MLPQSPYLSGAALRNMATESELTEAEYLAKRHQLAQLIREIGECAFFQQNKLNQRNLAAVVDEEFREATGLDITELI